MTRNLIGVLLAVGVLSATKTIVAQSDFERTITVDPEPGAADHQTIQAGIDDLRIGNNPTDRYTVLINAGTYTEAIVLGDNKENVDLVGVDRDAVIIDPPQAMEGITIEGSGARNNSIRNLVITPMGSASPIPDPGTGIFIRKTGAGGDPSDIEIVGVTIICDGAETDGIRAEDPVANLRIADCTITTTDGHAIKLFNSAAESFSNIVLDGVQVVADGEDKRGVFISRIDDLVIEDCRIKSLQGNAIGVGGLPDGHRFEVRNCKVDAPHEDATALFSSNMEHLTVEGCQLTAGAIALDIEGDHVDVTGSILKARGTALNGRCSDFVVLTGCTLAAERLATDQAALARGIRYDPKNIQMLEHGMRLAGCEILATNELSDGVEGICADTGTVVATGCQITVASKSALGGSALGVNAAPAAGVLIGCKIETSAVSKRESEVFDVHNVVAHPDAAILARDTAFSKWKGPVEPVGGKRTAVQRMLSVQASRDDAILLEKDLDPNEDTEWDPDGQPDVYRVLEVTGIGSFTTDFTVYVVGTDWAGNSITDAITVVVAEGLTAVGKKPFRTVDEIILPKAQEPGEKVSVGTTDKLGLYRPIQFESDVFQWSMLMNNVWSVQPAPLEDVDVDYATVDPGTITDNDDFEFAFLTP